ncbi:hypothetical protein [Amycolatopsis sp.]|uniref:hypothetical protein n=1 Tax=Amycolatopsis sp. TaxID=37632 RepID=UPI002630CF43|nr:hypothetical protein [Amycolatopsis sp.]
MIGREAINVDTAEAWPHVASMQGPGLITGCEARDTLSIRDGEGEVPRAGQHQRSPLGDLPPLSNAVAADDPTAEFGTTDHARTSRFPPA